MTVEMKKYKLGDLIDVSRGKSLAGEFYATSGNLVRLTMGNFDYINNCFKQNTSKDNLFFSGKVEEKFILNAGDIITPLTEQTPGLLGSTARIPESGKYIQSQDVALVRCKKDKLDDGFAYYLISSESVKKQLGAAAQQTKIRHTSPDKIKDCTVYIPEISTQKKIGSILSTLDQRIENLRAQNRVLEQAAKTIYDYTFLQCAGRKTVYNKTLKRNIPEGWEVKNIFEVFDIKYGFPFSTELFTEEKTDKPIVRIRDILEHTTSAYTTEDVDEKYRLQEGDLVIGMDGNFHMNLWTDNNSYLNQRCVRIRMNDNNVTSVQAKFALAPYIKAKEMTAKGSTVGHLSDKDLKGIFILMPDKKTLEKFNALVLPLFQKQLVNTKQIEALTSQRNTLLPLLMTGQIEV